MALPGVASQVASGGVKPGIFLDRDGVINELVMRVDRRIGGPWLLQDFRLFPGVVDATRGLKAAGYAICVVTNQPDIATGRLSLTTLEAMHDIVRREILPDDIVFCPHVAADGCSCRKPKPGMILAAAKRHDIDLVNSFMIGDRASDIQAGKAAGCHTILVAAAGVKSLVDAANIILRA